MALGRVAQPIGGIEGHAHRGVKAERVIRIVEIVIHRLGDADGRQPQLEELRSDAQGVLAAERDERVEAERLEVFPARLKLVLIARLERVRAGRAEDGAALVDDLFDLLEPERRHDTFHQPLPAQLDAVHLEPVVQPPHHNAADSGVQTRTIAAAR